MEPWLIKFYGTLLVCTTGNFGMSLSLMLELLALMRVFSQEEESITSLADTHATTLY